MEYISILKSNPLFIGITDNEIESILICLKTREVEYKKNQMILTAGSVISEFGILVEGEAHIIQDDYWGNRSIVKEIHEGELFGESYACIPNQELGISLIANKNCTVLFFNVQNILTTCNDTCLYHNRIIQNLLSICARKNILLTQKINHITQRTTRNKILSYLSFECQKQGKEKIIIPFNRQQLADYLSVDRSALSSELSRMKNEGLLNYEKNTFNLIS